MLEWLCVGLVIELLIGEELDKVGVEALAGKTMVKNAAKRLSVVKSFSAGVSDRATMTK